MFFTILMDDLAEEEEKDRSMGELESSVQPASSRRRRRDATHLIEWLDLHQGNPYPTRIEKEQLVVISGMTSRQLNDWFANARRNIRKVGFERWRKNKVTLGGIGELYIIE